MATKFMGIDEREDGQKLAKLRTSLGNDLFLNASTLQARIRYLKSRDEDVSGELAALAVFGLTSTEPVPTNLETVQGWVKDQIDVINAIEDKESDHRMSAHDQILLRGRHTAFCEMAHYLEQLAVAKAAQPDREGVG